jgi:hypothetical protein
VFVSVAGRYPATRLMRRKIIYHGGPTNSGKTYEALQALRKANPEVTHPTLSDSFM